jgi:CspA family cold shock protein
MPTGKVKWFNNAKGYGFIVADTIPEAANQPSDLFAHYSNINMEGYKTLQTDQLVSFDILSGNKGMQAVNIQLLPNINDIYQPALDEDSQQETANSTEATTH